MAKDLDKKHITSRDIQASERRQQILDVARKLFAVDGYHGTTMRSINKTVGMSESLTYHYFPGGKLEILDTIIREAEIGRANNVDEIIKTLPEDMSLREALNIMVKKMAENFEKNKEYYQILLREKNMLSPELQLFLSNMGEQFGSIFLEFLEKRVEKGEIRKMNLIMAASQFLHHIGSIALHQIMFSPGFNTEDYMTMAKEAVDFTVELWSA